MFNVTVTINGDPTVIDLSDDMITDEDNLIDKAKDLLDYEPEYDEEGDEIDPDITIAGPSECPIADAFEYVEWLDKYRGSDGEEIVEAAIALDIPPGDIDEAYYGEFATVREFIDNIISENGVEIPNWVSVDAEGTWESALRFDFMEENGHYFRQI